METYLTVSTKQQRTAHSLVVNNVHPDYKRCGWDTVMVEPDGDPGSLCLC